MYNKLICDTYNLNWMTDQSVILPDLNVF